MDKNDFACSEIEPGLPGDEGVEGIKVSTGDYTSSCQSTRQRRNKRHHLTINERTAMSRRPSIQKAHEAIHRFPSDAASGKTLSSRISLKMGPLSPSYARVIAIASCKSPTLFKQTLAASRSWSARRKKAAAYSGKMSEKAYFNSGRVQEDHTKPPFPKQGISVFQSYSLPSRFLEVIRK